MQKFKSQCIINEKGKKTGAILTTKECDELLEDLHDLIIAAERRDEPAIPFEELVERLRKDGLF